MSMATRKHSEGNKPLIEQVTPLAAITGGEFQIRGYGFVRSERPRVNFGKVPGTVIVGSDSLVIARVPEDATVGKIVIENGDDQSTSWACDIGIQVADGMHPVANPAVDVLGHCTGRLVSGGRQRPESEFDAELVFEACRRFDVAVEINSRPERLDPPNRLLRLAAQMGCRFSVDTDAHAPGQLEWQRYGCEQAANVGVPVERIMNALTMDDFLAWTAGHGA